MTMAVVTIMVRQGTPPLMRPVVLLPRPRAMWAMRHNRSHRKNLTRDDDYRGGDDDGGIKDASLNEDNDTIAKAKDGGDEEGG